MVVHGMIFVRSQKRIQSVELTVGARGAPAHGSLVSYLSRIDGINVTGAILVGENCRTNAHSACGISEATRRTRACPERSERSPRAFLRVEWS